MHNLSLDNWIASLYNNIYHTCTHWVIPRMFSCECCNNNTDAPVNWPIWIWWTTSKKCLLVLKQFCFSEDKECVLQSHHCPGYSHLLSHQKFCSGEIIFNESFMLHEGMTIWTKPANQPCRHYDRQETGRVSNINNEVNFEAFSCSPNEVEGTILPFLTL